MSRDMKQGQQQPALFSPIDTLKRVRNTFRRQNSCPPLFAPCATSSDSALWFARFHRRNPPLLPAASPPHIPRAVRGRAFRPTCFPGERRPGVGWGATGLAGAPPVEGHEVEKDAIPVTRSTRPSAPTAPPGLQEVPAPSTALPSPGPHPPQGQAPVVGLQTWERRCRPTSLPVQRRHRWRHRAASRRRYPPS